MDALNTLRAVLVGFAAIAAVLLGVRGQWVPTAIMVAGIAAHAGLWIHLRAQKRREAEEFPLGRLSVER
jgi:hypothetical protein